MTKKASPSKPTVEDSEFEEVPKPESPTFRESKVTKHLKCLLSDHEIRTMGQDLARSNAQKDEAEERKKAVDAQLKSEIESHATRSLSLARTINNGYQYKDVDCVMRFDYLTNTVTTVRLDIEKLGRHEVIDSRAMTTEERQVELTFDEEPVGPEAAPV